MELEKERLRREKQREARRRKILETSEARMKKLRKSFTQSEGDRVQGAAPAAEETLMQGEDAKHAPDPPDELIARPPAPSASRNAARAQLGNSSGASWLSQLVAVLQSDKVFRTRTAAAVFCSLIVTILNAKTVHLVSYVPCLLALYACILSWVFITLPDHAIPSPLGRLAVAKLALVNHPSLAAVFETACLFVCFSCAVLRDLCTMLFFVVLSLSLLSVII